MDEHFTAADDSKPPLSLISPFGALSTLGVLLAIGFLTWPAFSGFDNGLAFAEPGHQAVLWGLVIVVSIGGWLFARLRSRLRRLEQLVTLRSRQLHKTQERLRQADDGVRAADRAKSQFLASMSHELRTPLNAIIGFAEILNSEMLGPIGRKEYLEYSKDICTSGYQLLRVVNDILDLSRAQSGCMDLQLMPLDISEAIGGAIESLGDEAGGRGVTLEAQVPRDLPPLLADEVRLRQMLTHLISNGIKFTPGGGKVSVAARAEAGALVVRVIDTGIGIAQEHIQQALTPFGQVDGERNREYQGTGLGLPLTRSLVSLHGGSLAIDSKPGGGTTVTLTFPHQELAPTALAA